MISFKEYHKQMEILREEEKNKKNSYDAEETYKATLDSINTKEIGSTGLGVSYPICQDMIKKFKEDFPEETEKYNALVKALKDSEKNIKRVGAPKIEENGEEVSSDTNSDYQWLFDEWKNNNIQKALEYHKSLPAISKDEKVRKAVEYYIFSEIAFSKLDKEIKSSTVSPIIKLDNGKVVSVTRNNQGFSVDKNRDPVANAFFNFLQNKLKKIKFGNNSYSLKADEDLKEYIKKNYKKIDLNSEADRKRIAEDAAKEVWNTHKDDEDQPVAQSRTSHEALSGSDSLTPDGASESRTQEREDKKSAELSSASKEGRERASDPNDVSSLSVKSTNQQIIDAVNGTFGTSPKNPGKIFKLAIQRAENARAKIAKNVENDNQYMDVKDRKKELSENVILKELQTNPLLFEERKMLEEGIVDKLRGVKDNIKDRLNPTGRTATTRWDNALGKEDETAGSLEEFRLKMQEKADKVRDDITTKYVSDSTKADGIAKIKKYANDYLFGLNKKVNKLIKKNDYGFLGSMVRDAKIINADATRGRNEVYAASKYGKTREAEEKIILNNLDKLNDSPETIIEKKDLPYYKNILSLWAMMNKSKINLANMYTLDHPSKDLAEDLGPMEASVADKLMDFGKKYIYPGISERLFKHIGTLLLNGNYNKLVDQSIGSNLRSRLENEIKKDQDQNQTNYENSQKENSQNTKSQENNLNKVKEDLKKAKEEEGVSFNSVDNGSKAIKLLDDLAKANADNNSKRKVASEIIGYPSPKDTTWKITNNLNMKPEIANLLVNKIRNTKGLQWGIELINNDNKAKNLPAPKENNNSNSEEQKIRTLISDPYKNNYVSVKDQIQNSSLDDNKKQILIKDLLVREIMNKQKNFSSLKGNSLKNEINNNNSKFINLSRLNNFNKYPNEIIKDSQNGKQYKWDNGKISEVTGDTQVSGEQEAKSISPETEKTVDQQSKYLGNIASNKLRSLWNNFKNKQNTKEELQKSWEKRKEIENNKAAKSIVTEETILTEEGEPISKSGAETAVLKALSLNAQEAAEGKQWIIDNIYKGNPLASKIVDKFVEENSNKRNQAAKALEADKQVKQQAINNGTPNQVATAMQGTGVTPQQANQPQQPISNQQNAQPVANQQANAQQTAAAQQQPQQNKPVNATVTTAAADGFPNRLYKKIIRRKIGF